MRRSARRLLVLLSAVAVLAALAAPASAAQVVSGGITPAKLKGRPTAAMFFHPF
mgnify:FL=1